MTNPDRHGGRLRRSGFMLTAILIWLAVLFGGVAALIGLFAGPDGYIDEAERFMATLGLFLVGLLVVLAVLTVRAMPHHVWELTGTGVFVTERLALLPRRRRLVPWSDIGALIRRDEGVNPVLELVTRDGARHVLPAKAEDGAALEAFTARLLARAVEAGHPLPVPVEGLGHLERPAGLMVLLLATLLLGGLAVLGLWMLIAGESSARPRAATGIGLMGGGALWLGWMLRRAFTRRRRVLRKALAPAPANG